MWWPICRLGGRSTSAAVKVPTRCGSPRVAGTSSRSTSPTPRSAGPDGTFDLVSSQFLHSTVRLDREKILANAAAALRSGGLLVIVDHGSAPPWASKLDHHHEFPSAEEVVAGLDLSADEFERVRVDAVERQAVGPEGQQRPWMDNVIVLRRREETHSG